MHSSDEEVQAEQSATAEVGSESTAAQSCVEITEASGGLAEVARLSVPLVISFVTASVMGLTDMIVVGHVGTGEQGGVGVGSAISWGISSLASGIISVVSTFVAQAWGAGKREQLLRWACAGFFATALFTLPLMVVAWFLPDLVEYLNPNPALLDSLTIYSQLMVLGSPAMLLGFVFISFYRGVGDAITPMILSVAAIALNIALDILLVFGLLGFPKMGVAGAALASVASSCVEMLVYVALFFHGKSARLYLTTQRLDLRLKDMLAFFKTGGPIGFAWLSDNLAFNVMTLLIASSTAAAAAAHSIAIQITNFAMMPCIAVSIAGSTLVGQYIGARRPDLARRSAAWSLRINLAMMSTMSLIFVLFRSGLVQLFNPDPEVIQDGSFAITMAAVFQVFDSLSISADGAFRGAGLTFFPMVTRFLTMVVLLIPLGFFGARFAPTPLQGVWTAALITISLQGVIMYSRYRSGKWANKGLSAVLNG